MQRFKKRLRLFAERCAISFQVISDDAVEIKSEFGRASFHSTSYELMRCSIDLGNGPRTFPLPKRFVFDVTDRLSNEHLVNGLNDYHRPALLTLSDYINEENGLAQLADLQTELATDSSLETQSLGGNRILADYYRGILILSDDLVTAGTNVIDFTATSPLRCAESVSGNRSELH